MRKHVGNTMMVGLSLLLGCSPAPHRSVRGPEFYPGGQVAQAPAQAAEGPTDSLLPRGSGRGLAPVKLPAEYPPPGRILPSAPAPVPSSLPTVPEAVDVRVHARQGAGVLPGNVIPPEQPQYFAPPAPAAAVSSAVPARPEPEVVLLGVGGESPRGVTAAAATQAVPAGVKPETTPLAPELSQGMAMPPPPADKVPEAGYAHAADYRWLTGELEHIRAKNVWRLRYAPADQEDRYGGTVQLVGDGLPADCKSGQVVRVEGQVVNPEAGPRPPYWVRSFKLLKAAPVTEE